MKVIVVANQKGGVGKSTLACNLAVCAAKAGNKTMIIDADPQSTSMTFRSLRGKEDISAVGITKPTLFQDVKTFSNFDVILIDAGGRDNSLFRSAVMCAAYGLLLIPTIPSVADIWATEDTLQVVREARAMGINIDGYLLFNQIRTGTILAGQAREAVEKIAETNDVELLPVAVAMREAFRLSFADGRGVIEHEPNGKAATEIQAVYDVLIDKLLK